MKFILTALALTFSLGALASEIKIFDRRPYGDRFDYAAFKVNESLGRAWVEVGTKDNRFDDIDYNRERVQVEGLSYDAATKTVTLEKDGQLIDCGTLVYKRILMVNYKEVQLNGNCTFSSRRMNVTVDDGYNQYIQLRLQVFLNLN